MVDSNIDDANIIRLGI